MKTAHDFLAAVLFAGAALFGAASLAAPPELVTREIRSAVFGKPYVANFFIAASPALQTLSLSGLPPGLTARTDLLGNIAISGTPLADGVFPVTITARNADGGL